MKRTERSERRDLLAGVTGSVSGGEEWYKRVVLGVREMQTVEETTTMDDTRTMLLEIVTRLDRIV